MHVRVKICGVTTPEATAAAAEAGAEAVGFVFSESPRRVGIDRARELAALLPPFVTRVAVFRHPAREEVDAVVSGFHPHLVQLEPDVGVERGLAPGIGLLPVFHDGPALLAEVERVQASGRGALLLEAAGRGGRGIAPDWRRAAALARSRPLVLAGGLRPENVGEAIRSVRPFAVDVSSGVEQAPGVKDPDRIRSFVAAVRRIEREIGGELA